MNRELVFFLVRLFPVTFFLPIAMALAMLVIAALAGTSQWFLNSCNSLVTCYWAQIVLLVSTTKTYKLLLLMWGVAFFLVYGSAYKELKRHK